MANVNTLMQAVCHIQSGANGFQERYFLNTTTFAAAKTVGELIMSWRASAMAPGLVMTWARTSFVDTPRNTIALIDRPLKTRAYTETGDHPSAPPETIYAALHYRFETAGGLWGNRLLRGINDEWIEDATLMYNDGSLRPYAPGDPLPDLTDVGRTRAEIFRGMLSILRDNTFYAGLITDDPEPLWELLPWNRIIFRKVAKRDTGSPFGITRGRARKKVVVAPLVMPPANP